jgi:adenine nucleotide transporter 17
METVRKIIAREGISGLYAGIESAMFGISVTNFVYYYWYEWTRAFFENAALKSGRPNKKLTTLESMAAGAVAGSLTVLITNPIWVVNTRMTAPKQQLPTIKGQEPKKPSTIGVFSQILKEEGLAGFFSGVKPALVLVINPILQYTVFEQLKNVVEKRKGRVSPTDAFYLGALGKLVATSVTYPYITVKSRAHVAGKNGSDDGLVGALKKIVDNEGVAGLYGGMFIHFGQYHLLMFFRLHFQGHSERSNSSTSVHIEGCDIRRQC